MSDITILSKPQQVRKPRKGDCGLCHWFERANEEPKAGIPWAGYCMLNPPIAAQTVIPAIGPQGQFMKPQFQGIRPPTFETDRCQYWRPFGKLPDAALE